VRVLSSRGTRRRLIDVIVETVYDCSMVEDDDVQLQVSDGAGM
jgi:hypothetical protein